MFTITAYKNFDATDERVVTVATWDQALNRIDRVVYALFEERKDVSRVDFYVEKANATGHVHVLYYRNSDDGIGLVGEFYQS